jgi:TonB family protein
MRIDEVSVKQDHVQLEGSRIWVSFKDGSQINGITRNLLSLKIDLSQGSGRIERWRHALPNVLFTKGTSLSADAPEYWRKFLDPPSSGVPQSGPPSGITRVRINQGVSEAMILHKEQPKYPPEALAAHQQGKVVFETVIGKDGHIKYLQIAVPAGLGMDDAAAKAVLQWVYRPFYLKGIPVEVDTQIIVNFALQ